MSTPPTVPTTVQGPLELQCSLTFDPSRSCPSYGPLTWAIANSPNGPPCCQPNPSSCPSLPLSTGTLSPSGQQLTNPGGCVGKTSCQGLCSYPVSAFATGSDAMTFRNTFGNDSYTQNFMPAFCSQRASPANCPTDPVTGKKLSACSRFVSIASDGAACREWANDNVILADPARVTYCVNNDTPDCGCINAPNNPIFKTLQPGSAFNRGCWWLPCSQPSTYLVTQNYVPSQASGGCPNSICQTVINAVNSNDIDYNSVKQFISCGSNGGGGGGGVGSVPRWLWIGGIVLALLLLGVLGAFLFYRSRKTASSTPASPAAVADVAGGASAPVARASQAGLTAAPGGTQ